MFKDLTISLALFFYSSLLLAVDPEILNEANKCDSIFCPSTSRSATTSPHPEASSRAGLQVQKIQAESPLQIDPVILPRALKIRAHIFENGNLQSGDYAPSPSNNHQNIKASSLQKTQPFSPTGFAGGAPISGLQSGGISKPNLHHGLLYRDDYDKAPTAGIQPLIQHNQFSNPNANSGPDNDLPNTSESNGLKSAQANQALFGGSGGPIDSPFGQFESPSTTASSNDSDEGSNLLKKIAGALGLNHFFGVHGKQGSHRFSQGTQRGEMASGVFAKEEPLKDPRAILQAQLDKQLQQQRSIASSLEFGSSQSFLFHSMCQHYKRYAEKAHIPYSKKQPCPEK